MDKIWISTLTLPDDLCTRLDAYRKVLSANVGVEITKAAFARMILYRGVESCEAAPHKPLKIP